MKKRALTYLRFKKEARSLSKSELPEFAHIGFKWQEDDDETNDWYPQAIAEINSFHPDHKNLLAVVWHSTLPDEENQGVRISLVDISHFSKSIPYVNILLVDANNQILKNIHPGGLVFREGQFHLPDTDTGISIRNFPFDVLFKPTHREQSTYFHFKIALKEKSSFPVDIKPSFISYDWSREQFLIGTFRELSAGYLEWFSDNYVDSIISGPFYSQMQGAASHEGRLWISCSHDHNDPSYLYYGNFIPGSAVDVSGFEAFEYPPGLKALYSSENSGNLWLLTQYPSSVGGNQRIVFAIRRSKFEKAGSLF